jgi:glucokinase
MTDCWLGLDLGGSHVSVAALDTQGSMHYRSSERIDRRAAPGVIIAQMQQLLRTALAATDRQGNRTRAIGVGVPGVVDMAAGSVLLVPNLATQWRGIALRDQLNSELDVPVSIVNDVRAFTVAEHAHGAGIGSDDLLCMAIGTGIGGGLILQGQLYLGSEGRAGEMGHQTVDPNGLPCGCGNNGCLETVASGPAITSAAARVVLQGIPSCLGAMVDHDLNRLTPEIVGQAAAQGDAAAMAIVQRAGTSIGVSMANLVSVLNPDRIVIGGGIALVGEPLFAPILEAIAARCRTVSVERLRVVPATLGVDASMIGAAVWARVHPPGL